MFKKKKIDEVARCYRACFTDKTGKLTLEGSIVMQDLLAAGNVGDSPFDADPYVTAKNCGAMELANRVRAMVATDAAVFEQLKQLDDTEVYHGE